MKRLNLFHVVVTAAALVVSLLVVTDRAAAAPVNVLLGIPYTAQTNFTDFGSNDPDNFTDANLGTADYGLYFNGGSSFQPTVDFDMGSQKTVNTLGLTANDPSRNLPKFVELDFSNLPDFSSLVANPVVNLADTNSQQVLFGGVTARYVRFVFPFGSSGYYTSRSDAFFTRINELELSFVPEPTTLSLLALGGLMSIRRRRVA